MYGLDSRQRLNSGCGRPGRRKLEQALALTENAALLVAARQLLSLVQ